MQTADQAAAVADALADFRAQIVDLEAADRSGLVLMYVSNGLCIRWNGADDCGITTAQKATDVSGYRNLPTFTNGHHEPAQRVTRGEAIDCAIAELRRLIDFLSKPA